MENLSKIQLLLEIILIKLFYLKVSSFLEQISGL